MAAARRTQGTDTLVRRLMMLGMVVAAIVVVAAAGPVGMAAAQTKQPSITSHGVTLEVDGDKYEFAELEELVSEVEVGEPMSSTGRVVQRRVGAPLQPTIVLKRNYRATADLWAWHQRARTGRPDARRDATLKIVPAGNPNKAVTYALVNAVPTRFEITGLKAGGSEAMMETVTLVCEDVQLVSPAR